jgi:hypothetical protein
MNIQTDRDLEVRDGRGNLDIFATAHRWHEYIDYLQCHCPHCKSELDKNYTGEKCPNCDKDLCPF